MRSSNAPVGSVGTTAIAVVCCVAGQSWARDAESGFRAFEPPGITLRIGKAVAGEVCSDEDGPSHVCRPGLQIDVVGEEMCQWSENVDYPCTRYGYEFDFQGADPAETIRCEVERSTRTTFGPRTEKVTGSRTAEYTVELTAVDGHVFHHGFNTYAPVQERLLIGSVHTCFYKDVPLYEVEYIMHFEPEAAVSDTN